jgi:capsule polysaccharide export protein KpsE/RkpR
VRRITKEDLTIVDATGEKYPPKRVLTILLTLFLIAILYGIALLWAIFN